MTEPTLTSPFIQVPGDGSEAGGSLQEEGEKDHGANRREHFRNSIEVTKPISLALASADGEAIGPWYSADILDLSAGGLCLVLTSGQEFEPVNRLLLNLSSQPGFGVEQISVNLRWYVKGGLLVSLGVGFDQPFDPPPELA
ncbi:PilZ domain-containing protein [Cyanobium sp. ATX 6F1]|uniref:PilZ domain-containing protein n=1 Tax=unclassified Cyanobium TaxID=2627006 RepID=UPI0020CC2868|nr:PilZ domain-containing protein [Cyanobium sp. ATX 6F1]MCP9917651.1 PilZ domain-containing protein [Cyanobium sp. ATX 6F1]